MMTAILSFILIIIIVFILFGHKDPSAASWLILAMVIFAESKSFTMMSPLLMLPNLMMSKLNSTFMSALLVIIVVIIIIIVIAAMRHWRWYTKVMRRLWIESRL